MVKIHFYSNPKGFLGSIKLINNITFNLDKKQFLPFLLSINKGAEKKEKNRILKNRGKKNKKNFRKKTKKLMKKNMNIKNRGKKNKKKF